MPPLQRPRLLRRCARRTVRRVAPLDRETEGTVELFADIETEGTQDVLAAVIPAQPTGAKPKPTPPLRPQPPPTAAVWVQRV